MPTKKKLNQTGFGAPGLLSLIVVLAAIAGVGYYVWHKSHRGSTVSTSASQAASARSGSVSPSSSPQTAKPGWQVFSDTKAGLSFQYPGSWVKNNFGLDGVQGPESTDSYYDTPNIAPNGGSYVSMSLLFNTGNQIKPDPTSNAVLTDVQPLTIKGASNTELVAFESANKGLGPSQVTVFYVLSGRYHVGQSVDLRGLKTVITLNGKNLQIEARARYGACTDTCQVATANITNLAAFRVSPVYKDMLAIIGTVSL